jgi:hypothetical protein
VTLLIVSALKLVLEIALMAFIGQFLLALLAGSRRETNLFYRILKAMTSPFLGFARLVTPSIVLDRHVPIVAFLLTLIGWIVATIAKINVCVQIGVHLCR